MHDDPMVRVEDLAHRIESPLGLTGFETDPGHDTVTLGLDVYLPFGALGRTGHSNRAARSSGKAR